MKTRFYLIGMLVILAFSQNSFGQATRADIFEIPEITWFGLDFSKIRLIGPDGFTDPKAIKEIYFTDMNNLIRIEPDKYDLKKAFRKESVPIDLNVVKARNELPDAEAMVVAAGTVYIFEEETIRQMVRDYKPENQSGIGVVFIMESFNKEEEKGHMWVTFFDIATREVLLMDRMSGAAGGFGWRNYWARTYYNVLKEIEKTRYKAWSEK